jgi:hypothetical protein
MCIRANIWARKSLDRLADMGPRERFLVLRPFSLRGEMMSMGAEVQLSPARAAGLIELGLVEPIKALVA